MLTKSKLILAALLTAGAFTISAAPASAMPRLSSGVTVTDSQIEQAGWRCGRGAHVDRFGRCVPNFRPMFAPHRHPRRWNRHWRG